VALGEARSGGRDHLRNRGLPGGGGWNLNGAIVKVPDWLEALTVAVFFILVIVLALSPALFGTHDPVNWVVTYLQKKSSGATKKGNCHF
jgi:hypothetical protein